MNVAKAIRICPSFEDIEAQEPKAKEGIMTRNTSHLEPYFRNSQAI